MTPSVTNTTPRTFLHNGHLIVSSGPCAVDVGIAKTLRFSLAPVPSHMARAIRGYGKSPCDYFACGGVPIMRSLAKSILHLIARAKHPGLAGETSEALAGIVRKCPPQSFSAGLN